MVTVDSGVVVLFWLGTKVPVEVELVLEMGLEVLESVEPLCGLDVVHVVVETVTLLFAKVVDRTTLLFWIEFVVPKVVEVLVLKVVHVVETVRLIF